MKEDFFKQYPYLCDIFFLNKNTRIEQSEVAAKELISPYRLDFMAKLLWIEAFEGRFDKADADKIYEAHLQAFSNGMMVEPGQPEKKGLNSYSAMFSRICTEVKEIHGELMEFGDPIPVDGKHMAMDGAHRISAAIFYEKRVPIYQVFKEIPNKYDYRFFQRKYLDEEYILEMVEKYVSVRECRLYLLQKNQLKRSLREKIYKECAPIYMKKMLSGELVLIIDRNWVEKYGNEELVDKWVGSRYVEGTDAIINLINSLKQELLMCEKGYECKKRLAIFMGMCWNRLKVRVKRLLGRPV